MRISRHLFLIPLLFVLASCSRPTFDPAVEGPKLLRRDAEWADLATAGKDSSLSYFTDDILFITPGVPTLEGKAAVRAFVERSLKTPGFKIHWVSEKPQFSPDGKLAYMRGTSELTLPGPNGSPTVSHMRGVSVWRVDTDGEWRCAVDISTEQPAAPPPPAPQP